MDTTSKSNVDNGHTKETNGHIVVDDDDEVDHTCGWFGFRPKCLQGFAKPPWLLVCIMVVTFTQGKL